MGNQSTCSHCGEPKPSKPPDGKPYCPCYELLTDFHKECLKEYEKICGKKYHKVNEKTCSLDPSRCDSFSKKTNWI